MPAVAMASQRDALAESCAPAPLDHHVLRCLDSCHDLLALHHALSLLLRQGWLDMARARYSMGPSRITHPLFSLKPHTASAQLSFAPPDDVIATPSHIALLRLDAAANSTSQSADSDSHTSTPDRQGSSQDLPSHSGAAPSNWSHDDDVAYRRLMTGEGDSDSDSQAAVDTQTNEQTKPLRWFGAFVSPHLHAAQTSFESALETIVKIANAQREALHAHHQVMEQRGGMILDQPSLAEAQTLQNSSTS